MFEVMESLGIDYKFYEAVIMVLLLVIGVVFGMVIASPGEKKKKKNHSELRSFAGAQDTVAALPDNGAELPSIGSVRHGEKVVICGAEWTIM